MSEASLMNSVALPRPPASALTAFSTFVHPLTDCISLGHLGSLTPPTSALTRCEYPDSLCLSLSLYVLRCFLMLLTCTAVLGVSQNICVSRLDQLRDA